MKGIVTVAFVVFLSLLTVSCASAPHWTGAETGAGEFIWKPSPGTRFYVNLAIFSSLLLAYTVWLFINLRKETKIPSAGALGCFAIPFLLVGLILLSGEDIWRTDRISINSERIERTYSPSIWQTEKETIEWKNVNACRKFTEDETIWLKSGKTGAVFKAGDIRKGITLVETEEKAIKFVLEKWNVHHNLLEDLMFGNTDFTVSPKEEARLKKALNKYLPENVKANMSPESREYLSK